MDHECAPWEDKDTEQDEEKTDEDDDENGEETCETNETKQVQQNKNHDLSATMATATTTTATTSDNPPVAITTLPQEHKATAAVSLPISSPELLTTVAALKAAIEGLQSRVAALEQLQQPHPQRPLSIGNPRIVAGGCPPLPHVPAKDGKPVIADDGFAM
jgi:hypothetical protein